MPKNYGEFVSGSIRVAGKTCSSCGTSLFGIGLSSEEEPALFIVHVPESDTGETNVWVVCDSEETLEKAFEMHAAHHAGSVKQAKELAAHVDEMADKLLSAILHDVEDGLLAMLREVGATGSDEDIKSSIESLLSKQRGRPVELGNDAWEAFAKEIGID